MGVTFQELFLIIDRFRVRRHEIPRTLIPVTAGSLKPLSVQLYYRPDLDVALVEMTYQYQVRGALARLRAELRELGFKIIDPRRLDAAGRRNFYGRQLANYPVRLEHSDLLGAIKELSRRIADASGFDPSSIDIGNPSRPPTSPGSYSMRRPPRQETALERPPARREPTYEPDVEVVDVNDLGLGNLQVQPRPAPTGDRLPRPPTARGTRDDIAQPPPETAIAVQIERGDEWFPGRLRYLSDRRVSVATSASPRVGDSLSLSLTFEGAQLIVPALVEEVTRAQDLDSRGATGFTGRFAGLEPPHHRELVNFIRRAADAGVKFAPPPARRARFPLLWPVVLTPNHGSPFKGTARDVSLCGMFIHHHRHLPGDQLDFAIPLDQSAKLVRGHLRIVRRVTTERGEPGGGAEICSFAIGDSARYDDFVHRVRRRNERSLIALAAPDRLSDLAGDLRSVGYAVTSCHDHRELIERIREGGRRPDLAVLDLSFTQSPAEVDRLLALLREADTAFVTTATEEVEVARGVIDRLLEIG
jgi:hypothetical protein